MPGYISRVTFNSARGQRANEGNEYDYHQDVARSSYGDMLHDVERNNLYEMALAKAIKRMHDSGRTAEVLDIGTGTGLLSMMAVRHGADRVVACEGFGPIAECAREVMEANDMTDKISLVQSISHALSASDIGGRVNILVAEVFDTELIGEGALETFRHALDALLEEDSIVIPHRAFIIAQPVSCPFLRNYNNFRDICFEDHPSDSDHSQCKMCVRVPEESKTCSGLNSVHDIQLDCLNVDQFTSFSDPQVIMRFDFNGAVEDIKYDEIEQVQFVSHANGQVDCVFMWWELNMDEEGTQIISTAPYWAHPDRLQKQWRDHWMQAVYCPTNVISVREKDVFSMIVGHDEFSFWFNFHQNLSSNRSEWPEEEHRCCKCGLHLGCSRTRLAALNDPERNQVFFKALKKIINSESVCLSLSHNSILPILAIKLGAKKVFVVQPHCYSNFIGKFIEANNIENGKIKVFRSELSSVDFADFEGEVINAIIGEPYYTNSYLPWDDISYVYAKHELAKIANTNGPALYVKNLSVIPCSATIRAVAVQFKDLHKVKGSPVGCCQGFNLIPFDEMIYRSSQLADSCIECHPLWEYPCWPLSPTFELLHINFAAPFVSSVRQQERDGYIDFFSEGTCNGIAMWVDYNFSEDPKGPIICNGPTSPVEPGQIIQWNRHAKQGAFFLSPPEEVDPYTCRLKYKSVFNLREANFIFEFEILDLDVDILSM